MAATGFAGNWTYRSFHKNPDLETKADDVLLATGDLTLQEGHADEISGQVQGGGDEQVSGRLSITRDIQLDVSGTVESGSPPTIRCRARGIEGTATAGWLYDYVGYLVPSWPEDKEQRPSIVSSVIRTVSHLGSGGVESPAGVTLSFIAVSRDHPADS